MVLLGSSATHRPSDSLQWQTLGNDASSDAYQNIAGDAFMMPV
jgi:hypothetical protein